MGSITGGLVLRLPFFFISMSYSNYQIRLWPTTQWAKSQWCPWEAGRLISVMCISVKQRFKSCLCNDGHLLFSRSPLISHGIKSVCHNLLKCDFEIRLLWKPDIWRLKLELNPHMPTIFACRQSVQVKEQNSHMNSFYRERDQMQVHKRKRERRGRREMFFVG